MSEQWTPTTDQVRSFYAHEMINHELAARLHSREHVVAG